MKVKICGVTNLEDARWAANLGADFIGFNFYPNSPRKVSVKNAKDMTVQLPPFVKTVGIFVNEPLESIKKIIKSVPLKFVQLHGSEDSAYCAEVKGTGVQIIKVIGLHGPVEGTDVDPYSEVVDFFLFDRVTAEIPGGSGETFDWEWLQNSSCVTKPWFLAGGLTPQNVGQAISKTKAPYVDVCSGVERSPTRKDYEAMKSFIENARKAK